MILAFIKVYFDLVDYIDLEVVQIFRSVLSNSAELCSSVRLLHAAVLNQVCIIRTYTACKLNT